MKRLHVILLIMIMTIAAIGCVEKDKNYDIFDNSQISDNPPDQKAFIMYTAGYVGFAQDEGVIQRGIDFSGDTQTYIVELTNNNTSFRQLKNVVDKFVTSTPGVEYIRSWQTYTYGELSGRAAAVEANGATLTEGLPKPITIRKGITFVMYRDNKIEIFNNIN